MHRSHYAAELAAPLVEDGKLVFYVILISLIICAGGGSRGVHRGGPTE
jgi:hypothetical protein